MKFLVILGAAAIALTPLPRETVERVYARGMYPLVQPRLTALTNLTPFAWFDAMALLVACSILAMWVLRLRGRKAGVLRTAGGLAIDTATVAAVVYLWFLAAWGLNYQRQPLRAQLDFHEDRITREALRALAARNVESLNALHRDAHAAGWPELRRLPGVLGARVSCRPSCDLAMAWHAERRACRSGRSLNFYFTRVSDRRHDRSVLSGDARESEPAAIRAGVNRRARVGPSGRLCRRVRSQLRRLARLHARGGARCSTAVGCRYTER